MHEANPVKALPVGTILTLSLRQRDERLQRDYQRGERL